MKKRKLNYKRLLILILLIFLIITAIISLLNIIFWFINSNKTKDQINDINNQIKIEEVKDNDNTEIINQNPNIASDNPYWDYIKMNMINVDILELQKTNNETKGWIQINGTNINYPFVQTNNNSYYLNHSFNKKYNDAGWVFLDYRNNINNLDQNTIIYAHSRKDKTMFGSLTNVLKNNWLKNQNNYIIKLSTTKENTLWQIFSIYHIPTTSDYLEINNINQDFLNTLLNRSKHNFNTTVDTNDKILTLSTCYSDTEKFVVHAKLIKKSSK